MINTTFFRRNAMFGGVCGGAAKEMGIPTWGVRLVLFISFFLSFGTTFLLYIAAMVSFPSADSGSYREEAKFLGVCHRLAPRLGVHETWLRFCTLIAWVATAFFSVFAFYMVAFFALMLLDSQSEVSTQNTSGSRDVN